jgi:hypothetical protein
MRATGAPVHAESMLPQATRLTRTPLEAVLRQKMSVCLSTEPDISKILGSHQSTGDYLTTMIVPTVASSRVLTAVTLFQSVVCCWTQRWVMEPSSYCAADNVTRMVCAGSGAAGDGVRTSADSATHVAWPQVYILRLKSRARKVQSTQYAPQARQSMQSPCCHRHLHQHSLLTWAAGRA